jgi:hypothetical protein
MMKTYSHIRREALNQAAAALEPTRGMAGNAPDLSNRLDSSNGPDSRNGQDSSSASVRAPSNPPARISPLASNNPAEIGPIMVVDAAPGRRDASQFTSQNDVSTDPAINFLNEVGSSGWTRTSNPPVNRRKTAVLPPVAAHGAETPDRELDPMNTEPIDDPADAAVGRRNPRLDVNKGQEKGKFL